jgi:hypothetical protein
LVGEVARRDRARELAPLVVDLLFLGEGVGDQSEHALVVAESLGDGVGRGLALGPILLIQEIQRLVAGQLLAVDVEAQVGHGLVEQAHPRLPPHHVALVQHLLQIVGQLVRAEGAHRVEPRRKAPQRRVGQLRFHVVVGELVDLQGEEQGLERDLRRALVGVLLEPAVFGVGHVAGIEQLREAHHPPEDLLDPLIGEDGCQEIRTAEARQLAFVLLAEGGGLGAGLLEVALHFRRIRAGIKIGEVPGREVLGGGAFGGHGCYPGIMPRASSGLWHLSRPDLYGNTRRPAK